MTRRLPWVLLLFAALAVLSLIVQGIFRQTLIIPLINRLEIVKLYLQTVPDWVYWSMLLAGLALLMMGELGSGLRIRQDARENSSQFLGPVEKLARSLQAARQGHYSRWLVANELAELARNHLVQQMGEEDLPRRKLQAPDWNPPPWIQAYLEFGLSRPPIRRPRPWFFRRSEPLPEQVELEEVVSFLEAMILPRKEHPEDVQS